MHLIAELTIEKTYGLDTVSALYAPEAWKALEELDEKARERVRNRAIELAREKSRDLDVRLEDVLEAKHEFKLKNCKR